jgi:hypothetical protein
MANTYMILFFVSVIVNVIMMMESISINNTIHIVKHSNTATARATVAIASFDISQTKCFQLLEEFKQQHVHENDDYVFRIDISRKLLVKKWHWSAIVSSLTSTCLAASKRVFRFYELTLLFLKSMLKHFTHTLSDFCTIIYLFIEEFQQQEYYVPVSNLGGKVHVTAWNVKTIFQHYERNQFMNELNGLKIRMVDLLSSTNNVLKEVVVTGNHLTHLYLKSFFEEITNTLFNIPTAIFHLIYWFYIRVLPLLPESVLAVIICGSIIAYWAIYYYCIRVIFWIFKRIVYVETAQIEVEELKMEIEDARATTERAICGEGEKSGLITGEMDSRESVDSVHDEYDFNSEMDCPEFTEDDKYDSDFNSDRTNTSFSSLEDKVMPSLPVSKNDSTVTRVRPIRRHSVRISKVPARYGDFICCAIRSRLVQRRSGRIRKAPVRYGDFVSYRGRRWSVS